MKADFRCDCPVTSALDILGDRWSLVIIKLMLLEGKQTFKEFLESDEAIATNILSARLKMLEERKLITKEKLSSNKKVNLYRLTNKGLNLTPVIVELSIWSDENIREFHPLLKVTPNFDLLKKNKEVFAQTLRENYQAMMK